MSVFNTYARYYDLLNRDKDYVAEARYVVSLIEKYRRGKTKLLDIGCGTGRHAELFSGLGFDVEGLDRSEAMISQARTRCPGIEFHIGDITTFQFDKRFDVISALFHVASYLTAEGQLQAAFSNIGAHINRGGLFIFDCWHGPAVVHQQPEVRIRRLADNDTRVVRIAEPSMFPEEQKVDVNYQIFVRDQRVWEEFSEIHSMRYLFRSEIEGLLSACGMRLLHDEEWMTGNQPSKESWSVVYAATVE
ncbi:class I SAM-dependent DNA methyltransferase [Pseudomonadota bacterium]